MTEAASIRITLPPGGHLAPVGRRTRAARVGAGLFDAIGSAEKTLHANPGGHMNVPMFEADSSERFFARHLAAANPYGGSQGSTPNRR